MFLKHLQLTNFRNFSEADLNFSQTTLFLGRNAQGKSNLLESIYFLATSKSSKAEKDLQLIRQGENFVRIEGEIIDSLQLTPIKSGLTDYSRQQKLAISSGQLAPIKLGSGVSKLEIVMQKREDGEGLEKRLKVNGVGRRVTDYIGNLVVVYFAPEDINLVTGTPSLRRWHLDLTLAQIDWEYKKALGDYSEALVSRNKLLKKIREGEARIDELDFWTEEMLRSAKVISNKREAFFVEINIQTPILPDLTKSPIVFLYQPSVLSPARLKEYLSREIAAGTTLIGPQRDDFSFLSREQNLAFFGSRGEQRTAVLELKLAELKFIQKAKLTTPVLLLDDVFSELDEEHRLFVVEIIKGQQTILSAVEETQVPNDLIKIAQTNKVEKGQIL